jgi:hypothetical protein
MAMNERKQLTKLKIRLLMLSVLVVLAIFMVPRHSPKQRVYFWGSHTTVVDVHGRKLPPARTITFLEQGRSDHQWWGAQKSYEVKVHEAKLTDLNGKVTDCRNREFRAEYDKYWWKYQINIENLIPVPKQSAPKYTLYLDVELFGNDDPHPLCRVKGSIPIIGDNFVQLVE